MESIKARRKQNKKKKLLILSGISTFTVIGGTLAYFTTSNDIKNIISAAKYQGKIVENFIAPEIWSPGDTVNNDISITNNGNIDMALRATYTEKWINEKGEEIPLKDDNNQLAAIIEFDSNWIKDNDGYYYYGSKHNLNKLKPNDKSNSFIKSVTFNKNIKATLQKSTSDNGKTIIYKSSGNGYDNAKYTLTIKIDTIQYNQAKSIW